MATRPTRRKKETAPAVETVEDTEEDAFEELDEDTEELDDDCTEDDDLEELEEDEAPEEDPEPVTTKRKATPKKAAAAKQPTKTSVKKAPDAPEFSSSWLASHITEQTGQSYDSRSVRMLLRRVAKDPNGPLQRAIGEERGRYSFQGPADPTVKVIVEMVKSGEAQRIKREGLDAVKAKADAKKAAAKAAQVEEVEEAPAPRRTKATPAKAAPAKATTATRRRATKA